MRRQLHDALAFAQSGHFRRDASTGKAAAPATWLPCAGQSWNGLLRNLGIDISPWSSFDAYAQAWSSQSRLRRLTVGNRVSPLGRSLPAPLSAPRNQTYASMCCCSVNMMYAWYLIVGALSPSVAGEASDVALSLPSAEINPNRARSAGGKELACNNRRKISCCEETSALRTRNVGCFSICKDRQARYWTPKSHGTICTALALGTDQHNC